MILEYTYYILGNLDTFQHKWQIRLLLKYYRYILHIDYYILKVKSVRFTLFVGPLQLWYSYSTFLMDFHDYI